ncbi:polysaccharide biosynthesis tyrosine autokinase [Streptomyces sp. 8K308]|uniref:polysaccharide biosynthesis tyrosine autokinase n=1 Tax=Streptomyces sp. 8K308 TaxID=2530388 RepID=UPI001049CD4D|nr:polysaccharide biosynthesis tyrosine autokinase [Streptomyces sp. 8K308]TDC20743.1 polysaccharide biosynthesis tyrosine autokinase [Streptomyces sp. 8K308]
MNLLNHVPTLLRRWRAIVVLGTLGTVLGALATSAAVPQYQATTTLFVSLQTTEDTVTLNEGNSFALARVRSYAQAVSSPEVTAPVVESLDLDMTPAQLGDAISTEVPLDTVLLRISVTDTKPSRAARISDALADRFTEVIAEIERPVGSESSPVRLSIIEPAAVPSAPTSPSLTLNLVLGLMGGLALGVGFAVARESRDSSVRGRRDLTDFLGVSLPEGSVPPVLGSIPYDARASEHPIANQENAFGPRTEAFRQLCTTLRFLDVDRTPKIIAVTSALPNEGKSSIAINLAAALSELGSSVCLVDADLRRPCLGRTLGLVQDAGLTTLMIGQATVDEVLQSTESFSVLTSGVIPPNPAEMLASAQYRAVLRDLADGFDHVVVDTPPVLPLADVPAMAPALDGYLLVVRHGRTRRGQVADVVRALQRTPTTVLGSILNMVPLKGQSEYYGYEYVASREAQRRLPLRLLGRLRQRRRSADDAVGT